MNLYYSSFIIQIKKNINKENGVEKIICDNLRFIDSKGRTRLFNGMNIDDKLLDSEGFRYNLDEEFFKGFCSFGLDFIRLAVTWQNLEPKMGKYNENYLKSLDSIFSLAEKYGVYILLDMHQDIYSANGGKCVGDGAPEWAAITDGAKPRMPIFVWADGYFFGKWVHNAFDHFWNNDYVRGVGLQDRYCDLWKMLAERYGNSPALFGFDLMNEPFPGSQSRKMFIKLVSNIAKAILFNEKIDRKKMVTSVIKRDTASTLNCIKGDVIRDVMVHIDDLEADFDINKYSPFMNKTTAAIREVTDNGIIMMEQCYLCNSGIKQSAPPITVNGEREPLQCFGPHSYDIMVDTPLYKYANSSRVKAFFNEMHNTQLRLNVPVVVGEWGGCSDNTDTSWFPHAYELLDFFDEKQWSHAYWDYHGDDLEKPIMTLPCRTHPVAVAGDIICYGYDRDKDEFTLKFNADKEGETLIYVHKPFTLDGYEYTTVESYDNGSSLISVDTKPGESTIKININ